MKRWSRLAPAALVALATWGCERPGEPEDFKVRRSGPPVATQHEDTVERLKENAGELYEQRVTVNGALARVGNDARVFTLEGRGLSAERITVLTRQPVITGDAPLVRDDHVVVTGTLRRFVASDLERDLGWDLPPALERELRGEPVLVVDEIRRLDPPASRWSESSG